MTETCEQLSTAGHSRVVQSRTEKAWLAMNTQDDFQGRSRIIEIPGRTNVDTITEAHLTLPPSGPGRFFFDRVEGSMESSDFFDLDDIPRVEFT